MFVQLKKPDGRNLIVDLARVRGAEETSDDVATVWMDDGNLQIARDQLPLLVKSLNPGMLPS